MSAPSVPAVGSRWRSKQHGAFVTVRSARPNEVVFERDGFIPGSDRQPHEPRWLGLSTFLSCFEPVPAPAQEAREG